MPLYIIGTLVAFIEPVLHAGSNIFDHFLSNRVFARLSTLVFISSVLTLVFTSITVFLFETPHLLSQKLLFLAFVTACIQVGYLFPYYWSLGEIDTSIVASLFSLGKITLPILAFFILDEKLQPLQYAGFLIIIGSSIILGFDPKKFRLNYAFYLMLIVSVVLAGETIIYKYAFTHGALWGSFVFALAAFEVLIAFVVLVASGALWALRNDIQKIRNAGWIFPANELLGWGGNMADTLALTMLPVTVSRAIGSTQSLFVLLYAYIFKNKWPKFFREQTDIPDIKKKVVLYLLTIVGVVMVVAFGAASQA